jgi:hypothetical protein
VRHRDGRIRAQPLAGGELDRDEGVAQDALALGAREVVEADASDYHRHRDALRKSKVYSMSALAARTSSSVLVFIGMAAVACRLVINRNPHPKKE